MSQSNSHLDTIGFIHSTESFGTVDGPGIRFVVFMQGCPMRCKYCHNPDTWPIATKDNLSGSTMRTVDDIMNEYNGYKEFTKHGGITVTGGEPLMQMDFVIDLFTECKNQGIHTCIDTSGITFNPNSKDALEKFDKLISVTDLVMLDIKHIDDAQHKELTKQDNTNILAFAQYLKEKKVTVWIRHVVVPGITDNQDYLFKLGQFLGTLNNIKALDVLPYHTMGKTKYEQIGMEYPLGDTPALDKDKAIEARNVIIEGMKDTLRKRQ